MVPDDGSRKDLFGCIMSMGPSKCSELDAKESCATCGASYHSGRGGEIDLHSSCSRMVYGKMEVEAIKGT